MKQIIYLNNNKKTLYFNRNGIFDYTIKASSIETDVNNNNKKVAKKKYNRDYFE